MMLHSNQKYEPKKYSKDGLQLTQHFESCKYRAYKDNCKKQLRDPHHCCDVNCPGTWTIGYGHTRNVKEGDTCTFQQAMDWLNADLQFAVNAVNTLVCVPLSQHQFDALVDFVFNVGAKAFADSTLLKLLNRGEYDKANQQFDRWIYDNGIILEGLQDRRDAEQELFNVKG